MDFTTKISGAPIRFYGKINDDISDIAFGDLTIKWHIKIEPREYGIKYISTFIDSISGTFNWLTKTKVKALQEQHGEDYDAETDLKNYEQAEIKFNAATDEGAEVTIMGNAYELAIDDDLYFKSNGGITIEEVEFNFGTLKVYIS